MSELLSKEKEFLKLNDQLNRMASNAIQQQQHAQSEVSSNSDNTKTDTRFLTFQKTKGQSTLLRRRGAGDGIPATSETVDITNRTMAAAAIKEHLNATMGRDSNRHANRHPNTSTSPRMTITTPTPVPPSTKTGTTMVTTARKPPPPTKGNETFRDPNQMRTHNTRTPATNTSTFTVKYRNSKFVESPSLEVLVRDECSTIRSQKSSLDSTRFDGSMGSMMADDVVSNGRRSQASTLTLGSKKNVSTDGLIKFLKSKVTILEEDHTRLSHDMTKQKELLEKALERNKTIEQQRDQAYAKHNALKDQLAKVEGQLEVASQCNKDRSKEQLKLQKELETTKREMKLLTQNNNNLEKRLYRANEELETTRTTLTQMKSAEKVLKEQFRTETETKDKQIKNLKKQRADLLNAYKKQLFLIDNLKRQTVCMEQAKMIAFGEKEFSKVLEWDLKS